MITKKALAAAIGSIIALSVNTSSPALANINGSNPTILNAPLDYLYQIDTDIEVLTNNPEIYVVNTNDGSLALDMNARSLADTTFIRYDRQTDNFSFSIDGALTTLNAPLIHLSNSDPSSVAIDIGSSAIGSKRATTLTSNNQVLLVEDTMKGILTLHRGSTMHSINDAAIEFSSAGLMNPLANFVIYGTVSSNQDTAIDFSQAQSGLRMLVEGGQITGDILGASNHNDTLTIIDGSIVQGDIIDVNTLNLGGGSNNHY